MKIVNLYDEDGISVWLNRHNDIVTDDNFNPCEPITTHVIGRRVYTCSLEQAREKIRSEYISCQEHNAK